MFNFFGGDGSNTRGELIASWELLFFAQTKHISDLKVVRDSKVIIVWVLQKCQLQMDLLDGWKEKI